MSQDLQVGVPFGVVLASDTMVTKSVGKAYSLERTLCYCHWLPMNQAKGSASSCLPSGIINLAQGLSALFRNHGSGSFFCSFVPLVMILMP